MFAAITRAIGWVDTEVQDPPVENNAFDVHQQIPTAHGIRPLIVSKDIIDQFVKIAEENTHLGDHGIETCGILAGREIVNPTAIATRQLVVTDLIIPDQTGTPNSCNMDDDDVGALFTFVQERDLYVLGWIHTHPSQTCFMSSVDVHTQFSYQALMPEAISIVVSPSPSQKSYGIYQLVDPEGMDYIKVCRRSGHHTHDTTIDIYRPASHVRMSADPKYTIQIQDIRDPAKASFHIAEWDGSDLGFKAEYEAAHESVGEPLPSTATHQIQQQHHSVDLDKIAAIGSTYIARRVRRPELERSRDNKYRPGMFVQIQDDMEGDIGRIQQIAGQVAIVSILDRDETRRVWDFQLHPIAVPEHLRAEAIVRYVPRNIRTLRNRTPRRSWFNGKNVAQVISFDSETLLLQVTSPFHEEPWIGYAFEVEVVNDEVDDKHPFFLGDRVCVKSTVEETLSGNDPASFPDSVGIVIRNDHDFPLVRFGGRTIPFARWELRKYIDRMTVVTVRSDITAPKLGWGTMQTGRVGYVKDFVRYSESHRSAVVNVVLGPSLWKVLETDLQVAELPTVRLEPGATVRRQHTMSSDNSTWFEPGVEAKIASVDLYGYITVHHPAFSSTWKGHMDDVIEVPSRGNWETVYDGSPGTSWLGREDYR